MRARLSIIWTWGILGALAATATGADVKFSVSTRETYVGVPIQVQIVIEDATDHQPPEIPVIEDAEVRSAGTSRNVMQIGRQVTLSVTYTYEVIPRKPGTLVIPAINVSADGQTYATTPTTILVDESDKGDLLYVELLGERDVYVGESADVTLEIWLKPYEGGGIRLSENDMWQTIDLNNSSWGPFIENLQSRSPDVRYRTAYRADAAGRRQRYYVYSLDRTVWPERPGAYDGGGVTIVVDYPLDVRRSRFFAFGRHEIVASRPISATLSESRIKVKPLPAEGRPDGFRGAVGQYEIRVQAAPTEVSVGDPITLTLAIRGSGRLETLQAPQLARQETLTANFRVPDEELPGVMEGGAKVFTQSIRAKNNAVTQVPPIEFSFFDPAAEGYVTVRSDPIALTVKEASRMAVAQVVEGGAGGPAQTQLSLVESGLLANDDDLDALLSQQSLSIGWGTWGVLAGGPVLYVTCLTARRRRERLAGDAGFARRKSAHKAATTMLRNAAADANGSAEGSVAAALTRYVADRCNLPAGGVTRSDAVYHLRARRLPEDVVNQVDRLLAECEAAQYAGASHGAGHGDRGGGTNDLVERARRCVDDLERRKF